MIDEKGRLFGKINLIDLLVLLVVLALGVVLVIRLLGKSGYLPGTKTERATIEYTVKINRADPRVYDAIKAHFDAGDVQFMASGEEVTGSKVIDVRAEPNMSYTTRDDGTIAWSQDPHNVDIYFTARSEVTNTNTNAVASQEVRIGRNFIIKTRSYELTGIILSCQRVD